MIDVEYKYSGAADNGYRYNTIILEDEVVEENENQVVILAGGVKFRPKHYAQIRSLSPDELVLMPNGYYTSCDLWSFGFDPTDIVLVVEKIV